MTATAAVVADTHTFIWYVQGSPRLSAAARGTLDATTEAKVPILVSAITLVELRYLVEKGTYTEQEFAELVGVLDVEDSSFDVVPVDNEIARAIGRIPREAVTDPFDRMIAATALVLDLPLVTRDGRLRKLLAPRAVW